MHGLVILTVNTEGAQNIGGHPHPPVSAPMKTIKLKEAIYAYSNMQLGINRRDI